MRAVVLSIALAACTDPAVDMHLSWPQSTTAFDLSCVSAVDVLPIPVGDAKALDIGLRESDDLTRVPCVDLATPPTSFADVEAQIRGRFDVPLPPQGLAGIELRGRRGSCAEIPAFYESVFYGGAMYDASSDSLDIPIRHNISCNQGTTYTVKPVDLVSLVKTKTCGAMASAGNTFVGAVRPTLLSGDFSPMTFESGPAIEPLAMGGASLPSYSSSFSGSCVAAGWGDGNVLDSVTCINPGALTACAGSDVEVPIVSFDYAANAAHNLNGSGLMVIGAVWSNAAKSPVANATITVDEGATASVIYGDVGDSDFTPTATATATGTSGMFAIFSDGVVGVTVSAPGHPSRHVFVGASDVDPSTALVTLD